ncbi:Adaptin-N domain-containing protein [Mycena indigotica]|uniref:Adaptin-N domain-containing protein n=1 Tax=Mycena indigotica TaxID=2126181 RepID=A0A8H6TEG6_9AGAR|nr:Adaptin-N domain-containing protein [Mycena indigotica]KAF7315262.1 Adaptin-N domain-containing protein [Mycena indigotica]
MLPFASSGAFRTQYTLVRNVEASASPEIADSYLVKAVDEIQQRLRRPSLSPKDTRECLIILLYCSVSVTSRLLPALDFALPSAVNLVETAQSVSDKRIGYLFCGEIMPPDHELRLMLVNTLRKDLESTSEPRISLALVNLIASPSQDLIPAVQTRLLDLLSNNSPHIRRRALLAISALSHHEPDLLCNSQPDVLKRIYDTHPTVVTAALAVSLRLVEIAEPAIQQVQNAVSALLTQIWPLPTAASRGPLLQALRVLRVVGLPNAAVANVLEIIRWTSERSDHPLMFSAFRLLANVDSKDLDEAQQKLTFSVVSSLRPLINSQSPNDHYIFLSCLSCLDPRLWAGTGEFPSALDEWEVGRVMKLLDSPDPAIRRKTLQILSDIEPGIVNSYYSQSLESIPVNLGLDGLCEYTIRLLEVVESQTQNDGELYARHVIDLFAQVEARSKRYADCIMENVVERVLGQTKDASAAFQIGCVSTLVTSLASREISLGQTMMVIATALSTEYCGRLAVPPLDVLSGISSRLSLCSPAVQDACLLAMLRISVECEKIPPDVSQTVNDLRARSQRHIRTRCDQFTSLSNEKNVLREILHRATSASLPDFLVALERHQNRVENERYTEPSSPSTSASRLDSKLRYTAYEAPHLTPKLRDRRSSSRASSRLSVSSTGDADTLSAAAAVHKLSITDAPAIMESHEDLIALNDSPFISDPGVAEDFENVWEEEKQSQSARGWSEAPIGDVLQRLKAAEPTLKVVSGDQPPFTDEVKIILNGGALRLQRNDEGSCLWRLRGNPDLKARVKAILE